MTKSQEERIEKILEEASKKIEAIVKEEEDIDEILIPLAICCKKKTKKENESAR